MLHKEILEDLLKDSPCVRNGWCDEEEGHWCFIRRLIQSTGLSDRQAEQLRLVYDYKLMQSKKEGKNIGDKRAQEEFIDIYGSKFAIVYQEGMKHEELFERLFGLPYPNGKS
jgi:hypothetical protein